tara:strand:- start:913 stop:1224 length:312 start_codon:yes stop_codon:yes gene_type:complete
MTKENKVEVKKKIRKKGAGRPPIPKVSSKAMDSAKGILGIIAPHITTNTLSDVSIIEAVINYAAEAASILKKNVDLQKLIESNDTRAVIRKLQESLGDNIGNE